MSEEETLYHYCSNEAFYSIIKSRTIRLNDISHSNYYMEGKWIEKRLTNLLERKLSYGQLSYVIDNFNLFHSNYSVFAFCLSTEGDMLGQWRGYADDGHGIAIGFNRQYLAEKWGDEYINLVQICYEENDQEILLSKDGAIDKLVEVMQFHPFQQSLGLLPIEFSEEEKKQRNSAQMKATVFMLRLLLKAYFIKNPAFMEEKEQRLIKNSFNDGSSDNEEKESKVDFRFVRDKIIPYISLDLEPILETTYSPITEIRKGPKNQTPDNIIRDFMKKYGFPDVEITKSDATYR